jgi:hypothetical protein
MIRNSKQKWEVGQKVSIGFVRDLTVSAAIATPGDGLPDLYFLVNQANTKIYQFIPHLGLQQVDLDYVCERVAQFRKHCEQVVAAEIERATQRAAIARKFNELFLQAV